MAGLEAWKSLGFRAQTCPEDFCKIVDGPQQGPAERGHVKNVKKCQKSFSTLFDIFRAGQKRQNLSNIFFDTFRQLSRGTNFPAPFGGL